MKRIFVLLLAALMLLTFAACAKKETAETKAETAAPTEPATEPEVPTETEPVPAKEVTPAEVEAAVAAALGDGYLATVDVPEDELWGCALGWLEDLSILDSWVAKQTLVPSVNMDTLVVVRCKDAADADTVVEAFNGSFGQTVSYTRQYAFDAAKVQGARIYKVDDLVMYILAGAGADPEGSEEDAAKLAAAEYEKIDAAIEGLFGFLPENLAVIPEDGGNSGGFGFGG